MAEKAQLAVQAHIRHTKTDYDSLLRSGTGRGKARNLTLRKALDVQREWGPEHPGNRKLRTISRQISRKPTQTLKKKMAPIKRATAQKDTARSANPRAKKTSVASRGRPAEEGKAKDPRVTRSIARTKLKKQQRRKRRQAKRSSAALKTAV
jgi:hypothetical protein